MFAGAVQDRSTKSAPIDPVIFVGADGGLAEATYLVNIPPVLDLLIILLLFLLFMNIPIIIPVLSEIKNNATG